MKFCIKFSQGTVPTASSAGNNLVAIQCCKSTHTPTHTQGVGAWVTTPLGNFRWGVRGWREPAQGTGMPYKGAHNSSLHPSSQTRHASNISYGTTPPLNDSAHPSSKHDMLFLSRGQWRIYPRVLQISQSIEAFYPQNCTHSPTHLVSLSHNL